MNLDLNFLQQFAVASDPFPVELEKVYKWLELPSEYAALDIVQAYFEESVDYTVDGVNGYHLTVDCLRQLMMIVNTPKGKAVRRYYLECDRIKSLPDRPQQEPVSPEVVPIVMPTEKQLQAMRTRETERLEMEALPVLAKKIPKFRRAIDIARERATKVVEAEIVDW